MATEAEEVDSASPTYQEFARLYRIARAMRPSDLDRWNGELRAHTDDLWGSVNPTTGTITLNQEQVLRYLTGSPSQTDRAEQAQALQTVLHETYHQRVAIDARAGYSKLATDSHAYPTRPVDSAPAFTLRRNRPPVRVTFQEEGPWRSWSSTASSTMPSVAFAALAPRA
jgi:hypothetical protein